MPDGRMPLPLLTRNAEGADDDDGRQGPDLRAAAAGVAGGRGAPGPRLPAPGTVAGLGLRPRLGAQDLRRPRAALARPGRLLQAAVDPLLRGLAFRAPV